MASSYKEKAKKLKKAGLLDIDLRKKLSPSEKGLITKRFTQNSSIMNNLQDYAIRFVSKSTAKKVEGDRLRIKTKSGKVKLFIPLDTKNQSVKIKKGKMIKSDGQYSETIYKAGWKFQETATHIFKKKLERNEYVQIKIGGNRPISRTFKDMTALMNYAASFMPKDKYKGKTQLEVKSELIEYFSIVKVTDPNQSVYKGRKKENAKKKKGGFKASRY
jgi:hypothetical protein